jgi:hypothetical protein
MKLNVNSVWKNGTTYVNVDGVWKLGTVYTNVDGTWKRDIDSGVVATSGLVLQFEGYGKTGTASSWNDTSGNSHTMTLTNFPATSTSSSGWYNNSLAIDGTNDYGRISGYIPYSYDSSGNYLTLELYLETSTPTANMRVVSFGTTSNRFFFAFNNAISLGIGGSTTTVGDATFLPSTSTKTHYILTRDGAGAYALWKDGVKKTASNATIASDYTIDTGNGYILGAGFDYATNFLKEGSM